MIGLMLRPARDRSFAAWMLTPVLLASACRSDAIPLRNPSPAREAIVVTAAAKLGGRWSNKTTYCVEPDGRLSRVDTYCPSGDPGLDQVYREAVAGWAFQPARLGDEPIRSCTTVEFTEDFPAPGNAEPAVPVKVTPLVRAPPDHARLVTATASYRGRNCQLYNLTSFCVGTDGIVREITTKRSSGIPELDVAFQDTVNGWRFAPFVIEGAAQKICSNAEFNLRMQ